MRRNLAFEKSLAFLSHPLNLAAIGLLLLNDQLLRWWFPSWWTGNLSDFCWLFFVPFAGAALLSWIVPGKDRPTLHEIGSFGLSYLLIGTGYFLVKAVPTANELATRIFARLIGRQPALLYDPSDLLALAALALSAFFWLAARKSLTKDNLFPRSARGFVVLSLSAFVLLADAAAPDYGIYCFTIKESKIFASAGYSSYVSLDGGVNWQLDYEGPRIDCGRNQDSESEWQEVPGPQKNIRFRYLTNQEIQLSKDNGKTWPSGYRLKPLTEAEQVYYTRLSHGNPSFHPAPLNAAADPASGNMLFAMGHQGVLIYTSHGKWVWSNMPKYHPLENFPTAEALVTMLGGTVLLALDLALLVYSTLAMRFTRRWIRIVVLSLAWLGWLMVAVLVNPLGYSSYTEIATWLGILAAGLLILPLAIEQTLRIARISPAAVKYMAIAGGVAGLLFILPCILWVYGILPDAIWAVLSSLGLAAMTLLAAFIMTRRWKNAATVQAVQ